MSEKEDQTEANNESLEKNTQKEIESFKSSLAKLESAISALQSEVQFVTRAFTGNVEKLQEIMETSGIAFNSNLEPIENLLKQQKSRSDELKKQISVLTLLPTKTQEALRSLVPDITKEIESVHQKRISNIESSLKELQKGLNKEIENQFVALKDLSAQLQKQLGEDAQKKQESIDRFVNNSIEKIDTSLSKQRKEQDRMFQGLVKHTQKEIEAVTSNHGSKFLRNTAICLILAAIAGGMSSWLINQYFPRFVGITNSGEVRVHQSNVKVWNSSSGKNKN